MPPVLATAVTYYLLTVAFSKGRCSYVWVSRIINPAIGFMNNFPLAIFFISIMAVVSDWWVGYGVTTMLIDLSVITGKTSLAAMTSNFSNQLVSFGVDAFVIAVLTLVSIFGLKSIFRFQCVTFGIVIVWILTYLIAPTFCGSC